MRQSIAAMAMLGGVHLTGAAATEHPASVVENGGVATALTPVAGDAERGRALVLDRRRGLCLLCHSGPFPEERFQGNLAPSLAGAGSRNTPQQIRARLIDSRLVAPGSLMPAYYSLSDLARVGTAFAGRTIFFAQEVEDVVAFLTTLKE